jgi:carbonic anhydrase/acetyltransferase-like protein (isoleucine patch superfamily)
MRELTVQEIAQLEERGCWAEDWSDILVDEAFVPSQMSNVLLYGHVEIGGLSGSVEVEEGFRRRCCVRNATLRNVTIGDDCLVENVRGYISNTQIGDRCYVANIGIITNQEDSTFGNGTEISVLNEGGDANIVIFEGLTAQLAWLMVNFSSARKLANAQLSAFNAQNSIPHIGAGSRVVDVKEMNNVRIGEGCEVQGSCKLNNCTILSTDDASTLIGSDVIIEDSVVAAGASVIDGAKVYCSFVGESVHIGKGFSSEASVFFANSYMDNGESCAAFCGPFATSHHKSTLLIGGAFSFYNAGSGTNQSNHAYKMGPIHWGTLDRGSKTASGSHILWPAHVGSFSMVMGKVQNHPQVQKLPFSYVIAEGRETNLVPGINIRTVGTWRDVGKWPKRDKRPLSSRNDIINFAFPNPYIVQSVLDGKSILEDLLKKNPENTEVFTYHGCKIKRAALLKGIQYYDLVLKLFLYRCFQNNTTDTNESNGGRWVDMMGLLAPKSELDGVVRDIESNAISSPEELKEILQQIHRSYQQYEQAYANFIMQNCGDSLFIDRDHWMQEAEEAYALWLKMVKDDAEKEYQMGDVESDQLRDFLESIK